MKKSDCYKISFLFVLLLGGCATDPNIHDPKYVYQCEKYSTETKKLRQSLNDMARTEQNKKILESMKKS